MKWNYEQIYVFFTISNNCDSFSPASYFGVSGSEDIDVFHHHYTNCFVDFDNFSPHCQQNVDMAGSTHISIVLTSQH